MGKLVGGKNSGTLCTIIEKIRDLFSCLRLLLWGSCGAARLGRSPLGGLGLVGLLLHVLFLLILAVAVRGPLLGSLLPGLEAGSDKNCFLNNCQKNFLLHRLVMDILSYCL